MDQTFHGETHPYRGEIIRCQSDHDDYACSRGEVAMSGGDEMGPCTRVPIAKHVWVPVVTSCHARH
jgi:hypothetical protein